MAAIVYRSRPASVLEILPTSTADMRTDNKTLRRFLASTRTRTQIVYSILVLSALALIYFAARDVSSHLSAIEAWVSGIGPMGLVLFVVLFVVLTSFLVPESVLTVAAGAAFSLGTGMAVIVASGLCAAVAQYFVSRKFLKSAIDRRLGDQPKLAAVRGAVLHDELRMQVLLRLTPLNMTLMNYILGATGVRFTDYLLAVPAMFPAMLLEMYLGFAGKHLAHLASKSSSQAHVQDAALFGGLAVTVVLFWFVSRRAQQLITAGTSG